MITRRIVITLFTFLVGYCTNAFAEVTPHSLDIIYVAPNTGQAAGGHTALRLDKQVYHYQFFANGKFILVRDSWDQFNLIYTELCNRPITISRIGVDQRSYNMVRRFFSTALLLQDRDFRERRKLQTSLTFITNFIEQNNQFKVTGVGFFSNTNESSDIGKKLHLEVLKHLSENILRSQLIKTKKLLTIAAQSPHSLNWGEKLENLLQKQYALQFIQEQTPLADNAVIPPMTGDKQLSQKEIDALFSYRKEILDSIIQLIQTNRAGSGAALLLQVARYHTISLSLEKRQLHTLDPFPDDAEKLTLSDSILHSEIMSSTKKIFKIDLEKQLEALTISSYPELIMARIVEIRARLSEIDQLKQGKKSLRIARGHLVPETSGKVFYSPPKRDLPKLLIAKEEVKEKIELFDIKLKSKYDYSLFEKNCVTELNRAINKSFPNKQDAVDALGGWINPGDQFSFSPYMFHHVVKNTYQLEIQERIPSRRLRELERAKAATNSPLTWLRETNTLTSNLYTRRGKDTAFLLFTDDSTVLRPIFGFINSGYAFLYSLSGLFTLPSDDGERLKQGGMGIFYSLPELVFINIRKGTYLSPDYSILENSP